MSFADEVKKWFKTSPGHTLDWNGGFCCALTEIAGIQNDEQETPQDVLFGLASEEVYLSAITFFTTARTHERGHRLVDAIHKYKLGTVYTTPTVANPNSGNRVQLFIWHVDIPKWREFVQAVRSAMGWL